MTTRTASTRAACALFASAALLAACATPAASPDPQTAFWEALSSHCGKAYAGRMVTNDAADADLAGSAMVIAVRDCTDSRIAVPFHVRNADGTWDRSRTWLITRTAQGLRLKHDHRHEDGSADPVTMYGGDTASPGTARTQSFPVDAESIAMFRREGLAASVTNVWTVKVDPAGTRGGIYAYELRRTVATGAPAERHFRVEFDAAKPVALPPAAWGW
ncbi:hypothetical protein [Erythrobacter neustonensis]|uniref:Lipoprotein n=1 Tax=Erythrobacter neustonensis TaxID=1112 RepID=A0A192D458_9SPHN|nr:hypothetical protein [Erythrobacter neustonensis]ANK12549.1 hypothetical protein A9D12_05835 [Erythrobacter neustonensis]